jgi:16S rRNA (uracil1498-N3)-methyltransferase
VRVAEQVLVGNGRGLIAAGTVEEATPGVLKVRVDEVTVAEAHLPRVILAQALAKGDKDEMAVQASTELGVSAIIPWSAGRSVSRWEGPKIAKGLARWKAIVREASKQSIRPFVPEVLDLHSTAQLARLASEARVLVLDPRAEHKLSAVVAELDEREVVLVVGPEGGVSPAELAAFADAGATPVRLGAEVLRTSSAGPAALAVVNVGLGRW